MGSLRGITRIVAIIRVSILARILTPGMFGLFGIASLVLSLLEILTETGINIFLIQEKKKLDEYVSTAWIVSIIRGFVISTLIILFASMVSKYFGFDDSKSLIMLIGLVPLIRGFINPSVVKYQKELRFRKEFTFRSVIFLIDSATAVIFVFITRSPVGIVVGLMVGAIVEVIISHIFIKPKPSFVFEPEKFRKVIRQGKWVTFSGIFNYLFRQGDDAVVGKMLGESSLGIYQVVYKIGILPITEAADVFGHVTLPVYTRLSKNKSKLRETYFKFLIILSLTVISLGGAVYYFADLIILYLLGDGWTAGVPVLRILIIFGILRSISGTTTPLLLAFKKQGQVAMITFASLLGMVLTIFPLINNHGMMGAGFSAIVGSIFALPLMVYFSYKLLLK